jgi:hypothetical protein
MDKNINLIINTLSKGFYMRLYYFILFNLHVAIKFTYYT